MTGSTVSLSRLASSCGNSRATSKNDTGIAIFFVSGSFTLFRSRPDRSEEHTSELQSLMRISYAVFCLKTHNKHPSQYDHRRLDQSLTVKQCTAIPIHTDYHMTQPRTAH